MYIHFTRSNKIGSRVIRSLTGEDISHVALETGEGVVVHSTFSNIHIDTVEHFRHNNEIVRSYQYVGPGSSALWEKRALSLEGGHYDYLAFFGTGFRLLMLKTVGWAVPALAHWATKGTYMCTEFVDTIIGDRESNGQITPGQLEMQLRSKPTEWRQCK
jgi:hypothetical protein